MYSTNIYTYIYTYTDMIYIYIPIYMDFYLCDKKNIEHLFELHTCHTHPFPLLRMQFPPPLPRLTCTFDMHPVDVDAGNMHM